jgi:hypothetical protein
MGLLVAGVTGGASLIKSAQLRSVITEYQTYRVAYNTYYGMYSRVPGADPDTDPGKIETSTDAWDDLKTEGIVDKTAAGGFVSSRFRVTYWSMQNYVGTIITDFKNLNILCVSGTEGTATKTMTGIFLKKDVDNLLDKMDDGSPNSGLVRAFTGDIAAVPTDTLADTQYGLAAKLDF